MTNKVLSTMVIIGHETLAKHSLSTNLGILEKEICSHFGECVLESAIRKRIQNGKISSEVCYMRSFIHEDSAANRLIIESLVKDIKFKLNQKELLVMTAGKPYYY